MRVDASGFTVFQDFMRSGLSEQVVRGGHRAPSIARTTSAPEHPRRCVWCGGVNPNGRTHVLMTLLLDAQTYPASAFGGFYHSRWRIEEAFKRLKHRLTWEKTSGQP